MAQMPPGANGMSRGDGPYPMIPGNSSWSAGVAAITFAWACFEARDMPLAQEIFELVIAAKAAKAIDLEVPATFFARADHLIE
jgi:hypothetical protein